MDARTRRPRRRYADRLRAQADAAWARGSKDVAEGLHDLARRITVTRRKEDRR